MPQAQEPKESEGGINGAFALFASRNHSFRVGYSPLLRIKMLAHFTLNLVASHFESLGLQLLRPKKIPLVCGISAAFHSCRLIAALFQVGHSLRLVFALCETNVVSFLFRQPYELRSLFESPLFSAPFSQKGLNARRKRTIREAY